MRDRLCLLCGMEEAETRGTLPIHCGPPPGIKASFWEGNGAWGRPPASHGLLERRAFLDTELSPPNPVIRLSMLAPRPIHPSPTRAAPQWFIPPPFRASKVGLLLARWGEPEARRRDPSGAVRREAPIGRECARPPLISPLRTPAPPKSRRPREKPGGVSRRPSRARGVAAAQVSVPRPGAASGARSRGGGVELAASGPQTRTPPRRLGLQSAPALCSRDAPCWWWVSVPDPSQASSQSWPWGHRDHPGPDNSNNRSTGLMTLPRKPRSAFPRPVLMVHSIESKHPPGRGC